MGEDNMGWIEDIPKFKGIVRGTFIGYDDLKYLSKTEIHKLTHYKNKIELVKKKRGM
jgi:hypothetical protein